MTAREVVDMVKPMKKYRILLKKIQKKKQVDGQKNLIF